MDILFSGKQNPSTVGTNSQPDLVENLRVGILHRGMYILEKLPKNLLPLSKEDICALLTYDADIIRSRNAILADLIANSALVEAFHKVLAALSSIKEIRLMFLDASKYRKPVLLYRLLRKYDEVSTILRSALEKDTLCSELIGIREQINSARKNAMLDETIHKLDALDLTFLDYTAMNIGTNCKTHNSSYKTDSKPGSLLLASLHFLSYHKMKYDATTIFEKPNDRQSGIGRIKSIEGIEAADLENAILIDLARTHKKQFAKLMSTVIDISQECTELLGLEQGIVFYLSAMNLYERLSPTFPVCFADIHQGDFLFQAKGLYSCGLALDDIQPVCNDVVLNQRYHILTGANNSGKTEFLISFALAQLMFQLGLFVPCESLIATPIPRIHTLFMGGENETYTDSRMGSELDKFKGIMTTMESDAEKCLVLLNEPLTSTSADEGQNLCTDMVDFLLKYNACGILVTHFYGLYSELSEKEGDRVASLITVTNQSDEGVERTYKILEAPPEGKSFAVEMAKELGVVRHGQEAHK